MLRSIHENKWRHWNVQIWISLSNLVETCLKNRQKKIKMIQKTIIHISVKRALMFKWYKQYLEGRDSIEDDARHGRTRLVSSTPTDVN